MSTTAISKKRISVTAQFIYAAATIIAAVVLPQICHLAGAALHMGTSIGEVLLPMHLPIILCGILAGPYAAGIAGALAPLASFLMTGMPAKVMLPFMMIELAAYGVSSGLLGKTKLPTLASVFSAQVIGRAVRALAILFVFYVIGSKTVAPAVILKSIPTGIAGIVLQLVSIPLITWAVRRKSND